MRNCTGTAQPGTKSPKPEPSLPILKKVSPAKRTIQKEPLAALRQASLAKNMPFSTKTAPVCAKNHKSKRQHRFPRCRRYWFPEEASIKLFERRKSFFLLHFCLRHCCKIVQKILKNHQKFLIKTAKSAFLTALLWQITLMALMTNKS